LSRAADEYEEEWGEGDERPLAPARSLSLAFLATLPLFAAYEAGRHALGGDLRNTSELVIGRTLGFLGEYESLARSVVLLVLSIAAFVHVRQRHWRLGHSVLRSWAEGLAGAILLGPLLLLGTMLLGDSVEEVVLRSGPPSVVPDLARTALVFGASAWEELLFRVGIYSALYVVLCGVARFLGANDFVAGWIGEVSGWIGSSLFFAAIHLEVVVRHMGSGGEPFHSGLFAWRALAGLSLGLLYRWRGAGASAWAHGLFNVALLLGAGPGVFV
jgi:hypothetical protein